ncbi:Cu-Zn family superoxide dismutase [Streptosporangium becharense]|uniref:Superoxide dismutase [Cu-Zn] n=1 Tax=Streptosporangium becharense TaxID=1816182 RepID=A0A7W9IIU3_9ACTN|nr:superoxide dismutase family protein [Streptosporangium becharense]MBB2911407.1 Cu-Zn family superoxide dismutase [Streptosporangium becharense]MBB5821535.1 Cu-Zn family superoxide dismutase [Streptosporangium becharense]
MMLRTTRLGLVVALGVLGTGLAGGPVVAAEPAPGRPGPASPTGTPQPPGTPGTTGTPGPASPTGSPGQPGTTASPTGSPSPTGAPGASGRRARAEIKDADGRDVGRLRVRDLPGEGDRTRVTVVVRGLPPGYHGFHIHAKGVCDPRSTDPKTGSPFFSAGDHFSLRPGDHPDHSGDLPDLLVNENGVGRLVAVTDRFTVEQLLDGDGSAVVIHALPDNQANVPERYRGDGPDETTRRTGDSGGRIACGVITVR